MPQNELRPVAALMTDLAETKRQMHAAISTWTSSYFIWYTVFILLSLLSIVLPSLIAAALVPDDLWKLPADWWKRYLAFVAAVNVLILFWGNIGATAAKFDKARTVLKAALVSYPNEQSKLAAAYGAAMVIVEASGPTTPPNTAG